jgi:hypothetical protein
MINTHKSDALGDEVCGKETYEALLTKALKDPSDDLKKRLDTTGAFFLPSSQEKGTGTEKLLHMTYCF